MDQQVEEPAANTHDLSLIIATQNPHGKRTEPITVRHVLPSTYTLWPTYIHMYTLIQTAKVN